MTDITSPDLERRIGRVAFVALLGAAVVAALVGAGAGALMAAITPHDKFTWFMLLLIPVYIVLEWSFEIFVAVIGSHSKTARIAVMVALLAGFYVAWFVVRPL
jgi:hypothetical protein